MKITNDGELVSETSPHVFSTFASDIGFNNTVEVLQTDIGNRMPFMLVQVHRNVDKDITHWTYKQANGDTKLIIFNT